MNFDGSARIILMVLKRGINNILLQMMAVKKVFHACTDMFWHVWG